MGYVDLGLHRAAGAGAILAGPGVALLHPVHHALLHLPGRGGLLLFQDVIKVGAAVGVCHRNARPHHLLHLRVRQHLSHVEVGILGFQLLRFPVPSGLQLCNAGLLDTLTLHLLDHLLLFGQVLVLAFQLVQLPGRPGGNALLHGQLLVVGIVFHRAVPHSLCQGHQVVGIRAVLFLQRLHQTLHGRACFQPPGRFGHGVLHQLLGQVGILSAQQLTKGFPPLLRALGLAFALLLAVLALGFVLVLCRFLVQLRLFLTAKGSPLGGAGGALRRLRG